MVRKIWKWSSLITILIAVVKIAVPPIVGETKTIPQIETKPLDSGTRNQILQTSIQISMIEQKFEKLDTGMRVSNQDEIWQKSEKSTSGLGTLVRFRGEILLISHDHWSLFSSSTAPDLVTFRDATGSLLFEMSGTELLPLILFHDSGTFILKAPKALAAKVSIYAGMGSSETLNPGDIVQVVCRSSDRENQITVLDAEIIGHEMDNQVPMLTLRSLRGEIIKPGDSSGGIWINGRLTGNLWMTVREDQRYWWQSKEPNYEDTAFSLAAGLSDDLIDLLEILIQVDTPPTPEADGLS